MNNNKKIVIAVILISCNCISHAQTILPKQFIGNWIGVIFKKGKWVKDEYPYKITLTTTYIENPYEPLTTGNEKFTLNSSNSNHFELTTDKSKSDLELMLLNNDLDIAKVVLDKKDTIYFKRVNEKWQTLQELIHQDSKNNITTKNVLQLNEKAYQYQQQGKYKEAIDLLQKILKAFPQRVVAYLNLGDAFWGNNEKDKAGTAYGKYADLMKEQNKDLTKIPSRVYERMADPLKKK